MDFKIGFVLFVVLVLLLALVVIGGGALAEIASYSHIVTP